MQYLRNLAKPSLSIYNLIALSAIADFSVVEERSNVRYPVKHHQAQMMNEGSNSLMIDDPTGRWQTALLLSLHHQYCIRLASRSIRLASRPIWQPPK